MRTCTALFVSLLVSLGSFAVQAQPSSPLNEAVEAYNANDLPRAAKLFYKARMTDTVVANRAKAEYYLGHSLYKMGLYQSALAYYNAVFVQGPAHPYYLKGAEGLINVAAELRDDTLIPSQINKFYNPQAFAGMDPMALSRINFHVGLLLYRQEKYDQSLAFLGAVEQESSVFAKALFLQAIIHTRLGVRYARAGDEARTQAEYDKSIALFEQIVGLSERTEEGARRAMQLYEDVHRLWQLCTLNLARSYYGKGDFARAVQYYSRIPRFSQDWAAALFEIGWAFYMRQEYGRALGALHTLHSPHFENLFHPESWILKATIYYQVCLYDESMAMLDHFQENYAAMMPLIKELTEGPLPNEAFSALLLKDELPADDPLAELPESVKQYILNNPRVENFRHFLRSLEAEAVAIREQDEWKGERLAEELLGVVNVQRNLLQKTAGGFVKAKLQQAYLNISSYVSHAKMVKLEITTRRRKLVAAGHPVRAELRGKLAPRPRVPDETYNYWKFVKEYWRDELGFYVYTIRRACPKQAR